jgi:hypothetical protein
VYSKDKWRRFCVMERDMGESVGACSGSGVHCWKDPERVWRLMEGLISSRMNGLFRNIFGITA